MSMHPFVDLGVSKAAPILQKGKLRHPAGCLSLKFTEQGWERCLGSMQPRGKFRMPGASEEPLSWVESSQLHCRHPKIGQEAPRCGTWDWPLLLGFSSQWEGPQTWHALTTPRALSSNRRRSRNAAGSQHHLHPGPYRSNGGVTLWGQH